MFRDSLCVSNAISGYILFSIVLKYISRIQRRHRYRQSTRLQDGLLHLVCTFRVNCLLQVFLHSTLVGAYLGDRVLGKYKTILVTTTLLLYLKISSLVPLMYLCRWTSCPVDHEYTQYHGQHVPSTMEWNACGVVSDGLWHRRHQALCQRFRRRSAGPHNSSA